MKRHLPFLLCLSLILASCNSREKDTERLAKLDKALSDRMLYEVYFEDKARVLRDVLTEQTDKAQRYNICMRLADHYRSNSKDSTIAYLVSARELAVSLKDFNKIATADFQMAKLYIKTGYPVEANYILDNYRDRELPKEVLTDYYDAEHRYWLETTIQEAPNDFADIRSEQLDRYRKLHLESCEAYSWQWHNLKREAAISKGNVKEARDHAYSMVQISKINSREYAEAAYWYAHTFENENENLFEEWLVRSAIADIMCATKDYGSLSELVEYIFSKDNIDLAFEYVANYCMPDALHYNSKLRPYQIALFFPNIVNAYQAKHSKQALARTYLLLIVSILALLLLATLIFLFKRQKKLDAVRKQLQDSYVEIDKRNRELTTINERLVSLNARIREADKVKQEYITLFLGILSDNISTTRLYKNHVLKTIRQGNTKSLVEEIEQLPPIDNDILDFYKMFDQTFINLYPDFVEKFNTLLVDGAEIVPKGDDILTPELRIFALIKLGITDSSRIASLLHYSANTIYNYRAKTKKKARASKDDFEDAVREID